MAHHTFTTAATTTTTPKSYKNTLAQVWTMIHPREALNSLISLQEYTIKSEYEGEEGEEEGAAPT